MKIAKSIRDLFAEEKPKIQRLSDEVVAKLQWLSDANGWFLRHRIKEMESFALKLETGRVPNPRRMEDFFACTIIVPTYTEVSDAEREIREMFKFVERRPADASRTHKHASDFVFDDLRLYFQKGESETGKNADLDEYVFEVQIKTILQYAWGIATHDLIYKTDKVSWAKERVAFQIRAMLEHAELAISEASALASSEVIAKSNTSISGVQSVMADLEAIWGFERLPFDQKRLAEVILQLLRSCDIRPEDFRNVIEIEVARSGILSGDLSPYSFTVQALANSSHLDFKARLAKAHKSFRILVHAGLDLPDWMKNDQAHVIHL